jgi:hypothetical protein
MGRTVITPENRVQDLDKFEKLLMTRDNERMRIWCAEGDPATGKVSPWQEWVHIMKAPVFLNGEPVMEEVESRDGSKTERPKLEFIGQPICMGDAGILRENHIDPVHCPVCESAERGVAKPPEVRYAMNVIKYAIRPGSWELAVPFTAEILMWSFPASRFGKLVDIQSDAGSLLNYDLLLGPAEKPAKWQKYDIKKSDQGVAWRALAREDPRVAEYVKLLWTTPGNRATDEQLQAGCGRLVVNRNYLLADLRTYEKRWLKYNNAEDDAMPAESGQPRVQAGLDGLLDSLGPEKAAAAAPAAEQQAAAPAAEQQVAAAPAPAAAPAAAPVEDWLGTPAAASPNGPAATEPAAPAPAAPAPAAPAATAAPESPAPSNGGPAPGPADSWEQMLDQLK